MFSLPLRYDDSILNWHHLRFVKRLLFLKILILNGMLQGEQGMLNVLEDI